MSLETKILCKYLGGSHLYKLNTESSDVDQRGIIMNTAPSYILGLDKYEEKRNISDKEDLVYRELRHYMFLLKQSNTEALETLFCDESVFIVLSDTFKEIRNNRDKLIGSNKLFSALSGYASGELKLATGARSGQLGSKRKLSLEKYGFSPKNFTNLFRLMFTGIEFYETGRYIVDCHGFGDEKFNFLLSVKKSPEKHTKEELEKIFIGLDDELKEKYNKCSFSFKFHENIANDLLLKAYLPYLIEK